MLHNGAKAKSKNMAKLKMRLRRSPKHHPEIVTGRFDLHYEEIVQRNRFMVVTGAVILITGLAAYVPFAVYKSVAGPIEPPPQSRPLHCQQETYELPDTYKAKSPEC
jgi:hypothetical protein